MSRLAGEVLVDGEGAGPVLRIDDAISFWGGVDPKTARITDPRHARHDQVLTGRVLAIAELRGSSSSSAVLLELIHAGIGPAAIVLRRTDAILALGALVAREMGYGTLPMVRVGDDGFALLRDGLHVRVRGASVTVADVPGAPAPIDGGPG